MLETVQPLAAIATTPSAVNRLRPLWETGLATLWVPPDCSEAVAPVIYRYSGSLRDALSEQWSEYRGFVFCLATGAVVRLIAPLLHHKATDPAVVVVDGAGQFVISLCGGHQGGADSLARAVALQLGGTPILTGAANQLGLPGVDALGLPFGWQQGSGDWTGVSAAVAQQKPIQIIQDAGSTLWQNHLSPNHRFQFGFPDYPPAPDASPTPVAQARLWISPIQQTFAAESDLPEAQWHPRVLWVGVGCERGTSRELIETAVQEACRSAHLAEAAIAGVATLDLKADEAGLVELCRDRGWPLRCFPASDLRSIPVPTPSEVVAAEVGTPSVAEAAALLAVEQAGQDQRKSSTSMLRVPKRIVRHPHQPGAVTVAIAQAEREYIGRQGQLWLVGIGPGQLTQITPAAQTAIAQADAVIGYGLYVELIRPLLRPGQIVEALPITQERQRAERAIALADWGLTVAVISSGDCGIYGMAGLVFELLQAQGWDGQCPAVEVFPGITALQAAAARVGAPLMHDFCAISLSDLLTPWDVIERRLAAAAQADFVTALYNPRSQTRMQQIAIAQQIFLQHRPANTPVALVKSAYRPDEQITLTTLADLLDHPIDMLTLVLIGNQSTRRFAAHLVTPRGYLGCDRS